MVADYALALELLAAAPQRKLEANNLTQAAAVAERRGRLKPPVAK
jgi:hypothetical protein